MLATGAVSGQSGRLDCQAVFHEARGEIKADRADTPDETPRPEDRRVDDCQPDADREL